MLPLLQGAAERVALVGVVAVVAAGVVSSTLEVEGLAAAVVMMGGNDGDTLLATKGVEDGGWADVLGRMVVVSAAAGVGAAAAALVLFRTVTVVGAALVLVTADAVVVLVVRGGR